MLVLVCADTDRPGAYEQLEQYELGLKYFQKSTKLDMLNDEAWYGAAVCLFKLEKWHESTHFFQFSMI